MTEMELDCHAMDWLDLEWYPSGSEGADSSLSDF
jgi:hypothetical protein